MIMLASQHHQTKVTTGMILGIPLNIPRHQLLPANATTGTYQIKSANRSKDELPGGGRTQTLQVEFYT